jgi:hypothetical protein
MELTVERKSPYGFMAGGKWYNKSKFHPEANLDLLVVGQKIDATVQKDKFVVAYKLIGNGAAAQVASVEQKAFVLSIADSAIDFANQYLDEEDVTTKKDLAYQFAEYVIKSIRVNKQ